MKFALHFALLVLVACGGGGGGEETSLTDNQTPGDGTGAAEPTALELFGDCFTQDLTVFTEVLGALQGMFEDGGEVPMPEVDLLGGIVGGGNFPYTWDLDGDGMDELSGAFRFIDESGATTLPFSIADLAGLDPDDPLSLLDAVPAGSRLELSFELDGIALETANEGAGSGTVIFAFGEGQISGVEGSGAFSSGPCELEFDFDDIDIDPNLFEGFPTVTLGFTSTLGGDTLEGTITLDGTGTAIVSASLNGAEPQVFELDLDQLGTTGAGG